MNGILSVSSDSNSDNENTIRQTQSTRKHKWINLDKSFQNETTTTTKSRRKKTIQKKSKLLTKWDSNNLTQPKIIKNSKIQERTVLNILNPLLNQIFQEQRISQETSKSIEDDEESYIIDEDSTSSCSQVMLSQVSLNIQSSVSPIKRTPSKDRTFIEDTSDCESITNLELAVLEHYNISPIESSNSSTNTVTNFQTRSIPTKKIKHKKGGLWEKIDKLLHRQISDSNLWAYTRSNDNHFGSEISSETIIVTELENIFGRKRIGFKKDEKDCWIILDPIMRIFNLITIGTKLEVVLEGNQHTIDDTIIFTGIKKIALPKGKKISIYDLQNQQNEKQNTLVI